MPNQMFAFNRLGVPLVPRRVQGLIVIVAVTVLCVSNSTVGLAADAPSGALKQDLAEGNNGSLVAAFSAGQMRFALNSRYEGVDDRAFARKAEALTGRARLNFTTREWQGWQLFAEVDGVADLGVDRFNGGAGTTPGREQFPIVADPNDQRLNQLWLAYQMRPSLMIKAGRQRIKLDNDRFVGNVGWRQNEQTYDAIGFRWSAEESTQKSFLRLSYDYVTQVNRIFGKTVAAADHAHQTHLVNLAYKLAPTQMIAAYGYHIDTDDAATFSTRTVGVRYTGSWSIDQYEWALAAEVAQQRNVASNPDDFDASYWRLEPSISVRPWATFMLGTETLSGEASAGSAFRTPLATLHAFNGFADQFLVTPDAGLSDLYVAYKGKHNRFAWSVAWHHFEAQTGTEHFGSELDAAVTYTPREGVELLLKSAVFNAASDVEQGGFRDVRKLWAQVTIEF